MKLAWNYAVVNDEDELKNMDYLQHDIAGLTLKNVEIYAGTHGILSIKNSEGNQVMRTFIFKIINFIMIFY